MIENQMRICFISLAQFDKIWYKTVPMMRMVTELPTSSIFHPSLNTLFVVGKQEDFVVKPEDVLEPHWLATKKDLEDTHEA
jgi:hypothetical protein